jgi:hypothetical protein
MAGKTPKEEGKMKVYQVVDDALVSGVFGTREGAGLRLLEILEKTKNDHLLDLLRVDVLEVE